MLGDIDWELVINVALLFLMANSLYWSLNDWKCKKSLLNAVLVVIMAGCVALYSGSIYYGETTWLGGLILSVFSN